ncbi:MAG: hypothetical protein HY881_26440 [Deltaproteobacteria bacterium]|nr:hypothetical protein [Deltaproteobacteria bacterium]
MKLQAYHPFLQQYVDEDLRREDHGSGSVDSAGLDPDADGITFYIDKTGKVLIATFTEILLEVPVY